MKMNPLTVQHASYNSDLNVIVISVLGELPTLLIATVVVNIPFLGRKRSMAIAYFSCGVLCMCIFFL